LPVESLEGAIHIPLPQLAGRIGGFSRKMPLTVLCGSGYRSSIAASLLEAENVLPGSTALLILTIIQQALLWLLY
jgi:hydroxyacylglutathione hydrolase